MGFVNRFRFYFSSGLWVLCLSLVMVVVAKRNIDNTLVSMTEHYRHYADTVFQQAVEENHFMLDNVGSCALLQQRVKAKRSVEELQIIKNGQVICSSIDNSIPKATELPQLELGSSRLLIIPRDDEERGAVIGLLSQSSSQQGVVALAVIDRDFLRGALGYKTDERISRAVLFSQGYSAPRAESMQTEWPFAKVKSEYFDFEILVEASQGLVLKRSLFFFAISVLLLLISFAFLWGGRRWISSQQGAVAELKWAIKQQQFVLHYQPQYDVTTGQISGLEALVRWQHPEKGLIYPDVFIPMMEQFGLINALTDAVCQTVHLELSAIPNPMLPMHLSINFPAGYFDNAKNIEQVEEWSQRFTEFNWFLGVEITERQMIEYDTLDAIKRLRSNNVDVLLDDFGTGQTALAVLQNNTVDFIKIDKCFVDAVGLETVNAPVLDAIIQLAFDLNITLIAEGVETQEQSGYLLFKGVRLQQGYLFSRPKPLEELDLSHTLF
ncbi:EAL domain-containing protein [Vibrio vulnificus]